MMIFMGLLQIGVGIAVFVWMARENRKATEALTGKPTSQQRLR